MKLCFLELTQNIAETLFSSCSLPLRGSIFPEFCVSYHCCQYTLGLLSSDLFALRMNTLLKTLETMPIAATGLPNKTYSTNTAQMRSLNNTPDPQGKSRWSALDLARFLLALDIVRSHYPEYKSPINGIVAR